MIGKITPLVEGEGWRPWGAACGLFVMGAVTASAVSGWVLGAVGLFLGLPGLGSFSIAVLLTLAAIAVLDSGATPWQFPHMLRQTPGWFQCQFGLTWSSLLWGLDLGLGWTTRSCFATYVAATVLVLWSGAPTWGAVALGAYGLGKGLPMILAGLASPRLDSNTLRLRANSAYVVARYLNAAAVAWATGFVGAALLR